MKNIKSAGGVVINREGKVLVVSQHSNSWSLPKGHVEDDETDLEAAKREIYEESGVKNLDFIKNLGEYQRYRIGLNEEEGKSELKTIIMFLFKTNENLLNPIDPENPEARWVDKNSVADLLTHPKDKKFFTNILKEI